MLKRIWEFLNRPLQGILSEYYRPWMLPFLGAVATIGLIYLLSQGKNTGPVGVGTPPDPEMDISLRFKDVEIQGRTQGTPFYSILADEVEVTKDDKFVKFTENPKGIFYNLEDWSEDNPDPSSRKREITWRSEHADYHLDLKVMNMYQNVEIKTDSNDLIKTDHMRWTNLDRKLISESRSKVWSHKKTYFEADYLELQTESKELNLQGKVYIEARLKDGKDIELGLSP